MKQRAQKTKGHTPLVIAANLNGYEDLYQKCLNKMDVLGIYQREFVLRACSLMVEADRDAHALYGLTESQRKLVLDIARYLRKYPEREEPLSLVLYSFVGKVPSK